ncbi:DUF4221 family protein [Algoriphagus hitonicola]|uniref:Uncharacterized protein n=1 Tax=Algoriphagus hitonicola TaxID=435880 RepID=A0A1I2QP13_9BACT|nr:DUF4221 family protein [Algoriphagus hitonicola]SFG30028.1 protein of unknown function [Algoriphagus hitonicola]
MNNYKPLIFLVIAGSIACSSPENENGKSSSLETSYEIDTVMVDAGDHFFFLNWNLGISDISADKKILFNLNPQPFYSK